MNRKRSKFIGELVLTGMIALSGCGNTQGSTNVPVEQTITNETDFTNKKENPSTASEIYFTPLDERNMPDGTKQKDMLKMSEVNELRFLDL